MPTLDERAERTVSDRSWQAFVHKAAWWHRVEIAKDGSGFPFWPGLFFQMKQSIRVIWHGVCGGSPHPPRNPKHALSRAVGTQTHRARPGDSVVVLAAVLVSAAAAGAAPAAVRVEPADRPVLEAFLEHVDDSAARCTPARMEAFARQPEDIVWQASRYVRLPLLAYRLTGKPAYLDAFVERCDALFACLEKGPDGFLGWYGLPLDLFRHPDHPDRRVDVVLTSFEATGLVADFARTVQANAALRRRYARPVKRYLDVTENHLVRKWEARGGYKDLGRRGAVYVTHPALKPVKASLTEPHNKHAKIARALLALYKATGRDAHLAKAVRLAARFKRCLSLEGGAYRWNYWDPAGPWDVHPEKPGAWKHWIGPEHRGGYYGLSLSQAVVFYEHGLVFERADIDRFVRTQTAVCWNGDVERPQWARVDGRTAEQRYLCPLLALFDERIYQVAFTGPAQQERVKRRGHSWQGAVVAAGYLETKYLALPRWRGGKPAETDAVAAFMKRAANRRLLEALAFEVEAPGYRAPRTPAEAGWKTPQ